MSRNGSLIRTSFGDNGYFFVLKVNTSEMTLNTTMGTYKEIHYSTKIQTAGQSVMLTHTFTNTGSDTKLISFAIQADAQVANKDSVPIYKLENIQGMKFKNDPYIFDIIYTRLDSIWVGFFNNRTSNLWTNSTENSYTHNDSGFTYSIQNRIIKLRTQMIFFGTGDTIETPIYIFTPSIKFTPSNEFTPSDAFSKSLIFTVKINYYILRAIHKNSYGSFQ